MQYDSSRNSFANCIRSDAIVNLLDRDTIVQEYDTKRSQMLSRQEETKVLFF